MLNVAVNKTVWIECLVLVFHKSRYVVFVLASVWVRNPSLTFDPKLTAPSVFRRRHHVHQPHYGVHAR